MHGFCTYPKFIVPHELTNLNKDNVTDITISVSFVSSGGLVITVGGLVTLVIAG